MDPRAAALLTQLELEPHCEGGYFRVIHRSSLAVRPADGRAPRAALSAIHYLLPAPEQSRWHVVRSDEQWTFLEGQPLELLVIDPLAESLRLISLGPLTSGCTPAAVVPAGSWQAARVASGYSLVTCTVGPGFDDADFCLLADDPRASRSIRRKWPALAALL